MKVIEAQKTKFQSILYSLVVDHSAAAMTKFNKTLNHKPGVGLTYQPYNKLL